MAVGSTENGLYSLRNLPQLYLQQVVASHETQVKIVVNFFILYRSLKGDAARCMGKSINQEIRKKLSQTLLDFPIVPQKGHIVNLLDFADDFPLSEGASNYVLEKAQNQVDDHLFYREILSVVICKGYLLVTC